MENPKDKRVKREIANSNERRRMQSINAGFQKLKRLLPVNDGEKLSKASILQHASDFIQEVEREKLALYKQNTLFREILMEIKNGSEPSSVLDSVDLDTLPKIPMRSACYTNDARVNNLCNLTADGDSGGGSNDGSRSSSRSSSVNETTQQQQPQCNVRANSQTSITGSSGTLGTTTNTSRTPSKQSATTSSLETNQIKSHARSSRNTSRQQLQNHQHSPATTTDTSSVASPPLGSDRTTTASTIVDISDRNTGGVAKAAIALPLEVPYTSEAAIKVDYHHDLHSAADALLLPTSTRKRAKNELTGLDTQESGPKGQTLDTICKAIMEIEGDRAFGSISK